MKLECSHSPIGGVERGLSSAFSEHPLGFLHGFLTVRGTHLARGVSVRTFVIAVQDSVGAASALAPEATGSVVGPYRRSVIGSYSPYSRSVVSPYSWIVIGPHSLSWNDTELCVPGWYYQEVVITVRGSTSWESWGPVSFLSTLTFWSQVGWFVSIMMHQHMHQTTEPIIQGLKPPKL